MIIGSTDLGERPVLLAPLEDITDSAFRRICRKSGADMVYSEFVSSEGLIREAHKSTTKISFHPDERPIGIQIFGSQPESMAEAALIAESMSPTLIDINFGCPVRKVAMKGAGAALLADVPRMLAITRAVVKAVKLPVTVKTRLGWDERSRNIMEIALRLQDEGISAITIHGRTRSQLYGGKADWTLIGEVKNHPQIHISVIGNGDITNAQMALDAFERHHVDAVMIGRAAIGNPWIFSSAKHYLKTGQLLPEPLLQERLTTIRNHLEIAMENKGELKAVLEMRRHYAGYFRSLPHFKKNRVSLLTLRSSEEIFEFLDQMASEEQL